MPPTESSTGTDSGTGSGTAPSTGSGTRPDTSLGAGPVAGRAQTGPESRAGCEDTLDLRLPGEFLALFETSERDEGAAPLRDAEAHPNHGEAAPSGGGRPPREDLLDGPAHWGALATPFGSFQLIPVSVDRDLRLISGWMNDPAVAAFWELSGPDPVTSAHLRAQVDGDGRSIPCLGVLDGAPMSYFEIYRADLDPLARHYPARPHDTGIHLLIGGVADRGHGVGTALLRAATALILDNRPRCARVVAEPDLRNTPSVSAFLSAGFRFAAEVDLPGKRAALMLRERTLARLL
ncbi:GNAT family N-acetyltransferase [Streptomyces sp. SCSIO 30461]|uniref:GNAT family N-acetyltransferase n=1 Tax=Streptomyces sp. SCSIO 30461 TaxID=3118085 RepID=UPI0030CBC9C3